MHTTGCRMSRRHFVGAAATGASLAGLASTASLHAATQRRVFDANDRIRIGLIGCGDRGRNAHMATVHKFDKAENIEFVAVADPWRLAREQAAALCKEWYGKEPRQFSSYRWFIEFRYPSRSP